MGILNVTPDSFSDGGLFLHPDEAFSHAVRMIDDGAGIVDIGGESTRPGAAAVSEDDELARVLPIIETLHHQCPVCISIDTSKPAVARAAFQAGAEIINDVSGFRSQEMLDVAAETGAGIVIMHMQGNPRTMQTAPAYKDVVAEVREFFTTQYTKCISLGIAPEAIVFDPGIGFGKSLDHNLTLLNHLEDLRVQDRPLLLGVSLKSFIGRLLDAEGTACRNWPTVALTAHLRTKGANIFRVHDVLKNVQALRMAEAIHHPSFV